MGSLVYLNICRNRIIGNHADEDTALKLVRGDVILTNPLSCKVTLVRSKKAFSVTDPSLVAVSEVAIDEQVVEVATCCICK